MSNSFEDSAAGKAFLYCPIPGLDIVAGLVVLGITEAAKSGIKDGLSGVAALVDDAARRQLSPVVSGLESLAGAVDSLVKTQEEFPVKQKGP